MKLGDATLAKEFLMGSSVNELIFRIDEIGHFLSTEGGESLCRVSATKVDHVWHGRQKPSHCSVRSCEPVSVAWEAYSRFPLRDVKTRCENPMRKS